MVHLLLYFWMRALSSNCHHLHYQHWLQQDRKVLDGNGYTSYNIKISQCKFILSSAPRSSPRTAQWTRRWCSQVCSGGKSRTWFVLYLCCRHCSNHAHSCWHRICWRACLAWNHSVTYTSVHVGKTLTAISMASWWSWWPSLKTTLVLYLCCLSTTTQAIRWGWGTRQVLHARTWAWSWLGGLHLKAEMIKTWKSCTLLFCRIVLKNSSASSSVEVANSSASAELYRRLQISHWKIPLLQARS